MEASGSYLPNARGPCIILYVPIPTMDGKSWTGPFKPFQVSEMLCVRRESSESLLWLPRCSQENASLQPSQKERYACIELVTGSWSAGCLFVFMAFQSWRCGAAQEEEVRGGQGVA